MVFARHFVQHIITKACTGSPPKAEPDPQGSMLHRSFQPTIGAREKAVWYHLFEQRGMCCTRKVLNIPPL